MNTSEANEDKVKRFLAGLDRGDLEVIEELVAEEVVDHNAPSGTPEGREGVKAVLRMMHAAFPDAQTQIVDMIANGDKVAVRTQTRGTSLGPFMDVPATGKAVMVERMDIMRFEDGMIVERWSLIDLPALYMRLGVMPRADGSSGSS